jgi:hypothetical protein
MKRLTLYFLALLAVLACAAPVAKNHTMVGNTDAFRSGLDVSRSAYPGITIVHKFGKNSAVGTSYTPLTISGFYRTPTALTSLEIVSSSANDTSAGTGARTVYIQGIGTGWAEVSETVTMNGTTAVDLANQYFRIYRAYVVTSGTYATSSAGSHAGDLTIRVDGGGDTWATINGSSSFPKAQTEIGVYTVPAGYTAYVKEVYLDVESNKAADILMFQRPDADTVSAPYAAMRVVQDFNGVEAEVIEQFSSPLGPFPASTDIGFMAKVASGTGSVSVDFEILLVED